MREYSFRIRLQKKSKLYKFIHECEELKFISETITKKEFKSPRTLLKRVMNIYKSKNKSVNQTNTKLRPEEIDMKVYAYYLDCWRKFKQLPGIMPKEYTMNLRSLKKKLMQDIVYFLKEKSEHIHLRPINPFIWQVELFPKFFSGVKTKNVENDLKELNMNMIFEFRFDIPFFTNGKFPFITLLQPRVKESKIFSKGGMFSPDFKYDFMEVGFLNDFLQRLLVSMKKTKLKILKKDLVFYDENLTQIEHRRKNLGHYRAVNSFSQRMQIFPPIFHFQQTWQEEMKKNMEFSNRVILPATTAQKIFNHNPNVKLPLFFELVSYKKQSVANISRKKEVNRKIYCGVKEFTAQNGRVIAPQWMMKELDSADGEWVNIRCIHLKSCNYLKMQPEDPFFFKNVKNYKTLLESQLRDYLTLTIGDSIPLRYGNKVYKMNVLDLKPDNVCTIVASSSGFLELKLDVIPPMSFDPKLHNPTYTFDGKSPVDIEPESPMTPAPVSPVKLEGVKYKKCDNCGHSVKEFSFFMHIKHCSKNYEKCEICGRGIKKDEKVAHVEKYHSEVSCELCSKKVNKRELKKHTKMLCPERMVTCKYLGCPVVARDKQEHEDSCGSKTEQCFKCSKYVFIRDVEIHKDSNCIYGETTADKAKIRNAYRKLAKQTPITPGLRGVVSDFDVHMNRAIMASMGVEMDIGKLEKKEGEEEGEMNEDSQKMKMYMEKFKGISSSQYREVNSRKREEEEFKKILERSKIEHQKFLEKKKEKKGENRKDDEKLYDSLFEEKKEEKELKMEEVESLDPKELINDMEEEQEAEVGNEILKELNNEFEEKKDRVMKWAENMEKVKKNLPNQKHEFGENVSSYDLELNKAILESLGVKATSIIDGVENRLKPMENENDDVGIESDKKNVVLKKEKNKSEDTKSPKEEKLESQISYGNQKRTREETYQMMFEEAMRRSLEEKPNEKMETKEDDFDNK